MNNKQRSILKIVLVALILMFIFPPFHVPVGQGVMGNSGFSFILSPPESHSYATPSVNALQLVAQWVGVVIIGSVAFLLRAGPEQIHSEESGRWVPALGEAFRRSKTWIWPAVVFTAVSLLWVGNPKVFAVKLIGHAGAALLFYVTVLFWHWTRAMRGIADEAPTTAKKYSLKRILITIAVGVIVAMAFIFSFADRTTVASKPLEPDQSSSNPFDDLIPAQGKEVSGGSFVFEEAGTAAPQPTKSPRDLFEEAGISAPHPINQSIDEFLGIAPKTDKQIHKAR